MNAKCLRVMLLCAVFGAILQCAVSTEGNTVVTLTAVRGSIGLEDSATLFTTSGTQYGAVVFPDVDGLSSIPYSLAVVGNSFFVGDFQAQRILKFRHDGTPLGVFSELPSDVMGTTDSFGFGHIESDLAGNIYAAKTGFASRPRTSLKFDPSGAVVATFTRSSLDEPDAIDADKNGNVYILQGGQLLYKFSSTGTFITILGLPQIDLASDMAIDEERNLLYVTDEFDQDVDLKIYSIGANSLSYLRGYDLPLRATGISYSDVTKNLYVSLSRALFEPDYAVELSTDGTLLNTFEKSPVPAINVYDVAFVVPEPTSCLLMSFGLATLCFRRR